MNNSNNQRSSERGQVLVLVVLGFVVLLGFVALAIDGSMVYSDRRFAQNASDASSLAGGGAAALSLENSYVIYQNFSCSNTNTAVQAAKNAAEIAAVSRASSNDFTIDRDTSDKHGVHASCGSVDNGSWIDKYIDINTWITSDTKTTFAQFVFRGPLRNTVDSVVRVRPRTSVAFGYAVVALRRDCPNTNTGGVHFDGNSELDITGGGVFSNACIVAGGSVDVNVSGGDVMCSGANCYTSNGSPSVSPTPGAGTLTLPEAVWTVPAPTCPNTPAISHHGSGVISPGNYTNIRVNSSSEVLELQRGLYCISGDFVANGGTITGDDVTLYLTGGDFDISGGVQINLKAPYPARSCTFCQPDVAYGPLGGVLIYLAEGNTGEASLLGTSDSEYLGLVYAPSGMIEAGGSGSELSTIHAQLVADTVKLHGTTTVDIHFDDQENYTIPSLIELYK